MKFNKITIIGIGLLGGSLARDLRHHQLCKTIVGVSRSTDTANLALHKGVVDQVASIEEAVIGADLIVFATPMQAMIPSLAKVNSLISPDTIITDVGSVKNQLYEQLKSSLPERLSQFVLAHPIAGGEKSGVAASTQGLFKNKNVILTESAEVNTDFIQKVRRMWETLGARVITMGLTEHDAVFAKTSHLPHVIAFSIVNYLNAQEDRDQLFDMAAAGFYDFTRIASSDAQMWRDISITNRDQMLIALASYRSHLDEIYQLIADGDEQGIYNYFESAKSARDLGLVKKNNSSD